MKKRAIFMLVCLMFVLVTPKLALAHILKADKSIGAVMHISPDDDPIAGQQTDFLFEFKDKKNTITPDNCECTVAINAEGKELFTQSLFRDSTNSTIDHASFSYTFPRKDTFLLTVVGKPKEVGAFQPFTLTYDIRVTRETSVTLTKASTNVFIDWTSKHMPHLIGSIVIALFVIIAIIRERVKEQK